MSWSGFLKWIWWQCLFCDQSDHIWQYWQTYKCYICSGVVFWYEFDGNVHFVIGVTIYGNTSKHISVIYVLERFFDANSMVVWGDLLWQYKQTPPLNSHQNHFKTYTKHIWHLWVCQYGHSDHKTDITIEFTSKNHSRTYITLMWLPVLPYMVTLITKWTSPSNPHQKTIPEHM